MNKRIEADLRGIGFESKTNFTGSETSAFSTFDSTTGLEQVKSVIDRVIQPGKVIRLYHCFACKRNFPASRMASALVVCRDCFRRSQDAGRLARRNQIDRIVNDIQRYLRGRLEAR